jgi:transposase InsO family protein
MMDMVPEAIKEVLTLWETQTGARVREVQSDRGREYVNVQLRKFFWEKGIMHDTSVPYTPEQNGHAERLNRTLLEDARHVGGCEFGAGVLG